MISVFEDFCDGGEEEVHVAVDDGHEDRHGQDDGGEDEHSGGADDGPLEEVAGREARVELRAKGGVAGFFAEPAGLAFKEDGWVGFTQCEDGKETGGAALG